MASLELGDGYASYDFEPWAEVHSAEVTTGVQGSPMVPFLVRVTGAAQDCLPMDVRYEDEYGGTIASFSYPVQLYTQDDGSLVSERHYVILDGDTSSGTTFLEVTVGGVTEVYTVDLQVW